MTCASMTDCSTGYSDASTVADALETAAASEARLPDVCAAVPAATDALYCATAMSAYARAVPNGLPISLRPTTPRVTNIQRSDAVTSFAESAGPSVIGVGSEDPESQPLNEAAVITANNRLARMMNDLVTERERTTDAAISRSIGAPVPFCAVTPEIEPPASTGAHL